MNNHLLIQAGTVFMGFFAIMNPLANTPIFLGLTDDLSKSERQKVALRAVAIAFLIVVVFALSGQFVLKMFGITLAAFRLAGGILIFMVGSHMLTGGSSSPIHSQVDAEGDVDEQVRLGIAVSPLAMPIMAGPGTIATTISFSSSGSLESGLVTIACFAALCLLTYFCFVWGENLVGRIGSEAISAVSRIMGLILAVIGVQMAVDGIKQAFLL